MALFRSVSVSFWTDSKVIDDFTPEDRYFYLYLFTNPHTNLCGCYEISIRQMVNELGYSKESVENLLKRFERVHRVIRYSTVTKEVLLLNWHKYNWTRSSKMQVALDKEIGSVKEERFKGYLEGICLGEKNKNRVSIPYGYPMDTTNTNTISNADTNAISNATADATADAVPKPEKHMYTEIIGRLNDRAGTAYKSSAESTRRVINARINEGFTLDNFFAVIDKKVDEWKGTDMEKYLRPSTLFGTKFESYLNQKTTKKDRYSDVDEWLRRSSGGAL